MRLVCVSSCGLDKEGRLNPFAKQERDWLCSHFERVSMVSFYGVCDLRAGDGDSYAPRRSGFASVRAWLVTPFSRDLWRALTRLRGDGKLNAVNALKLFAFAKRGRKLHYWLEGLLAGESDENATLYSFWMSYDAYAAALSKRKHPATRFVARGHAFDVDVERNPMNPYLMKDEIAKEADGLYPISEVAREQLMSYMRGRVDEGKVRALAMGSAGAPTPLQEPPYLRDGVLRIVSCAMVIPIKQVALLAAALADWAGCPVHWTHIGGGEGEAELRALAEEKLDRKDNVIYKLLGTLAPEEIEALYEQQPIDLFVNTSRREGVPVSIMEAMRHGVPFVAPDVGGVGELARDGAGYLYAPEDGAAGVRAALARYASFSPDGMRRMRQSAKARWDGHYQSTKLLGELFPQTQAKEGNE